MNLILLSPAIILLGYLASTRYPAAIILLSALLPTYLLRTTIFGLPTNFFELAVIIVFIIGLLQSNTRTAWLAAIKSLPRPVIYLLTAFLAASLISSLISTNLISSLGILKGWIIFPIILAWLIYAMPNPAKHHPAILQALVLSGLAMSLIALAQLGSLNRIQGVYDVPNSLALFLAPLAVISIWLAITDTTILRNIVASTIISLALLATQSVSAIIAVTLSLIIGIMIWAKPQLKTKSIFLTIIFLAAAGLYLNGTGRLAYLTQPWLGNGQPNSISVRQQLWSVSQDIILDHPVLGVGLGQFEPIYQQYLSQRHDALPEYVFRDPHNWPLSFWLNLGLLGLLSFTAINILAIRSALMTPASQPAQATALALITLLVFGLVDTVFWKNDLSTLHFLLLAIALAKPRSDA